MRHGYQSVTVGYLAVLWIGSRLSSRYRFPLSFVWCGSRIIGSLKQKIYTVGGQLLDKVKQGINIVRNANGKTQKVTGK